MKNRTLKERLFSSSEKNISSMGKGEQGVTADKLS